MKGKNMDEAQRKDLDEIRRLLYMVLVYRRTEKYEIAGTLINALLHHQKVSESRDEVIDLVIKGLDGDPDAMAWLRAQGQRINDELEGSR